LQLYCCARACLELCLIVVSLSCNAVGARIWREKEKYLAKNVLGTRL
jgi:hypothetical protein